MLLHQVCVPAMAYHTGRDRTWPPGTLVADYTLNGIPTPRPANWRCCELADLHGPIATIALGVSSHTSQVQHLSNLQFAATLLAAEGTADILVHERKLANAIRRMAEKHFRSVVLDRCGKDVILICQQPSPGGVVLPQMSVQMPLRDGRIVALHTRPDLFSGQRLDRGTELLIRTLTDDLHGRTVLDFACGYGPLAVFAAAQGARVTYADVDLRAVRATAHNLAKLHLLGHGLLAENLEGLAPRSFDLVLSHPPTHAGSAVLRGLFSGMVKVSGALGARMVVRELLNYEKWLGQYDWAIVAREDGYKVIDMHAVPTPLAHKS